MSDLDLHAAFGSVTEEDGARVVAFAASDDPEDGYVFVQQDMIDPKAPLYLEVSDEIFGGYDALEAVQLGEGLITLTIRPDMEMRFGAVAKVHVHWNAATDGGAEAAKALATMTAR
jgi:Immunity protein 10